MPVAGHDRPRVDLDNLAAHAEVVEHGFQQARVLLQRLAAQRRAGRIRIRRRQERERWQFVAAIGTEVEASLAGLTAALAEQWMPLRGRDQARLGLGFGGGHGGAQAALGEGVDLFIRVQASGLRDLRCVTQAPFPPVPHIGIPARPSREEFFECLDHRRRFAGQGAQATARPSQGPEHGPAERAPLIRAEAQRVGEAGSGKQSGGGREHPRIERAGERAPGQQQGAQEAAQAVPGRPVCRRRQRGQRDARERQ
jgi:hypothetical protein